MWNLEFISEEDFDTHVTETVRAYEDNLEPYDVRKFNRNIIDPVKMVFDKSVYGYTWEEIIKSEIFRQRDKSNTNSIGYFHQNIFEYIEGCKVPPQVWDVVFMPGRDFEIGGGQQVSAVYVEMKNKHNTMNSSSSAKTYMKMQNQLLHDDNCACFLVEAIAKNSQNIPWAVTVDGNRQKHERIRRVSLDQFYALVTGDDDAFYKVCMALPSAIERVLASTPDLGAPRDTVLDELRQTAANNETAMLMSLYLLGFSSYLGFDVV